MTSEFKQIHLNERATLAMQKHDIIQELDNINKRLDELQTIITVIDHYEAPENENKSTETPD